MLNQLSFQLKTKLQVNSHADLYLLKSETFCETMLFGFTKIKKGCEHNHFVMNSVHICTSEYKWYNFPIFVT